MNNATLSNMTQTIDDIVGIDFALSVLEAGDVESIRPEYKLRALTQRQEEFCQAWLQLKNATRAYRAVFDVDAGVDADRVRSRAKYLKNLPSIQARMVELRNATAAQAVVSTADVLSELKKIAFFDIRNLYDDEGNLLEVRDLDDESAANLTGLETVTETDKDSVVTKTTKIKLADKRAALVDIGKHLGMFTEKVEHTGANGAPLIPEYTELELARRMAFVMAQGMKQVEGEVVNG